MSRVSHPSSRNCQQGGPLFLHLLGLFLSFVTFFISSTPIFLLTARIRTIIIFSGLYMSF